VGLADRLADSHLVRRTASAVDHRRVELRLTPKGEAMIEHLSEAHLRELKQISPQLQRLMGSLPDVRPLPAPPEQRIAKKKTIKNRQS
jgi:DNA-binding MarR family transcriptional regulator